MIRFAVIGTGWRSEFYARVALAMPEQFEMVAWLCRGEEKMTALYERYGIHTTMSEAELENLAPDFVVCAVDKKSMSTVTRSWAKRGIPVLSETPAALDAETLKIMRQEVSEGLRIQVAEQYFLRPELRVMTDAIDAGLIGEPVSINVSAMHDYHAASIIRRMLHTGLSDITITGKSYMTHVTNTKTRYETLTDGKIVEKEDRHLCMEFGDGKVAFYDFMAEQYRSTIRHKYINVRGTRGEIINDTLYYLDENNIGQEMNLLYGNAADYTLNAGMSDRNYNKDAYVRSAKSSAAGESLDMRLRSLRGGARKYEIAGLHEDEAAIAELLIRMKEYVDTGKEAYPMDEALYDAYISIKMEEAAQAEFTPVKVNWESI